MSGARKPPRWTVAFLRALERSGEVRSAAVDAGIDYTTAYARRKAHPGFEQAWKNALRLHSGRAEEEQRAAIEAVQTGTSLPRAARASRAPPSPVAGQGSELVSSGGQMKRIGEGRWSQAKEKRFFEELAATANVRRAAKAAGVSPNAVFTRRLKHPLFQAKWAAVLATAKASIDMYLVEASNKTFDPDALDTGEVEPKVSVAEAIRIVQLHGSNAQREDLRDPYAEQAASSTDKEATEIREWLVRKLRRLRDRDMPEMIAQGWQFDEEFERMIPPGWIRDPDHVPSPPDDDRQVDALDQ